MRTKTYSEVYNKVYNEAHTKAMTFASTSTIAVARAIVNPSPNNFAGAKAKASAEAKVTANAKADALTIPLYDLATDCLRLSMHFFYPIQQCAQHVYHSALPLSPTSSQLHKSCLQGVIDSQLSLVGAFSGAPDTWGLLLRTINIRPRQFTCIATYFQRIIAACEDIVNVYDAVTFVLRQSLHAPETVTKIQASPDGFILFFAHSSSITMWDVQTGGLIHTFTIQSKINDIAVSTTGDHIACGSSDGSVTSWNIHTKGGRGFGYGQPVVTVSWLSPVELMVVTEDSIYIANVIIVHTSNSLSIPGCIWGMVRLGNNKFLVGTSLQGTGVGQELLCSLEIISHRRPSVLLEWQPPTRLGQLTHQKTYQKRQPPTHLGQLMYPIRMDNEIVCITSPSGVQLFNTNSNNWTNNPPPLDAATSVAVSLNRNLVVQTKDSIQIFSTNVLTSGEARKIVYPSHIYPLGEKHIICILQPNRHLALLELETLRKLNPSGRTLRKLLLANPSPSIPASLSHGLVAEFGTSVVIQAWQSGTPIPEWTETIEEDTPLGGLSPEGAWIVTVHSSPRWELHVKNAKDGSVLASISLEGGNLETGEVYDLAFDSETRFHLKIDGPGWHMQIPYDIIASPLGHHSYTVTQGEPVPLLEPRARPPYSLDANCEWVLDAKSRKICWISPGNVRRGNGGHFWAGLSLVMVGNDGVVRKLSFKEPTDY